MELLDGESLADRLARGPLPFDEARGIALVVVETLGAVHERGLIHRDLKPANIFLTRHGVKLLDFGLARDVGPAETVDTRLTQQGLVVGTPRYLAPEQVRGQAVDHRSDLFAVGAVIYEMLDGPRGLRRSVAGRHPARGGVRGAAGAGRQARRRAEFEHAVRQALAKDPAQRPATAALLAQALRAGSSTDTVAMAVPAAQTPADAHATDRVALPPAAA